MTSNIMNVIGMLHNSITHQNQALPKLKCYINKISFNHKNMAFYLNIYDNTKTLCTLVLLLCVFFAFVCLQKSTVG